MKIYIPCGFRCHTKIKLNELKVFQPSLPFDWGFFPTQSIIKFLENDIPITLENTSPCTKNKGRYINKKKKIGFKFKESTYNAIDSYIEKNGFDYRYLYYLKGYYTLCRNYGFVLSHYNWHKSNGKYQKHSVEENIKNINSILQRRKERLLNLIEQAKEINLCFLDLKNYLLINNRTYKTEPKLLIDYFQSRFKGKKINYLNLESIQTL